MPPLALAVLASRDLLAFVHNRFPDERIGAVLAGDPHLGFRARW
jgi:hypothetical protein